MILVAYLSTIVLANWLIVTFGLVPVGFGLMAPAGVYAAGLAFTLRDMLQERAGGTRLVLLAILVGSVASAVVANGPLAIASAVAFFLSEMADFFVYTPLRVKGRPWVVALIASNLVGLTVDSAVFLWLAFGSLDYLLGQVVGKAWMTALAVVIYGLLARRPSRQLAG